MKKTARSTRPEKLSAISEVIALVEASDYCFVLNYGNLTVANFSALRLELAAADSQMKVVKNAYLARAIEKKGWEAMASVLTGPTAVVTGAGDPAAVAKVLVTFLKKHEAASVKGAQLDASTLTTEQVESLSKLPPRDVLRAHLLGTMLAPATSLVRVLVAPLTSVLYVLKAKGEKDESAA